MTVKVTKPAINLREKLAEVDKPSGIAGEAMLRAETPQEQFNLIGAGRKNLIINGSFLISQRGDYDTSTSATNNAYWVDRYQAHMSGVTASNARIDATVDGGVVKALHIEATSATSGGYLGHRTQLETHSMVEGKEYTYSAWIKTNMSGVVLRVNDFDNTDINSTQVHSGSGQWERLTMTQTFTGNSPNPLVRLWVISYENGTQSITSGDYIQIAMPQLELGKVATPFEHRSYGEELALCQRYYETSNPTLSGSDGKQAMVASTGSNYLQGPTFKVTKRATPTMIAYDGISEMDGSISGLTAGTFNHIGINGALRLSLGGTGRIDGQVYRYHWSADAEL